MATGDILDFDRLLAPISEESPAGEQDFRAVDSTGFWELRSLRDELKKVEDNAFFEGDGDAQGPDGTWGDLLEKAGDALATQTKDVQLVCWMLEALPRVHGFAGLRDGLRLLARLSETYFEQLHPQPDVDGVHEDGIYTCVEPFDRLDRGPASDAVGRVVVTQGSPPGPYTLWHYEQAVDLSSRPSELQEERKKEGWVTLGMFQEAVNETAAPFFNTLYGDLGECEAALKELDELLEEKCGEQDGVPINPSVRTLRTKLEDSARHIRAFAAGALQQPAPVEESEVFVPDQETGQTAAARVAQVSRSAERTRESALRELEELAVFFRKTEPHSILSYQLQQVVRYGRMSLPELLRDVLKSDDEKKQLFRHIGIENSSDE